MNPNDHPPQETKIPKIRLLCFYAFLIFHYLAITAAAVTICAGLMENVSILCTNIAVWCGFISIPVLAISCISYAISSASYKKHHKAEADTPPQDPEK